MKTNKLTRLFSSALLLAVAVGCTQEASRRPNANQGRTPADSGGNTDDVVAEEKRRKERAEVERIKPLLLSEARTAYEKAKSQGKSEAECFSIVDEVIDFHLNSIDDPNLISEMKEELRVLLGENQDSGPGVPPSESGEQNNTENPPPNPNVNNPPSSGGGDHNTAPPPVNPVKDDKKLGTNDQTSAYSSTTLMTLQSTFVFDASNESLSCFIPGSVKIVALDLVSSKDNKYYIFTYNTDGLCSSLKGKKVIILGAHVSR